MGSGKVQMVGCISCVYVPMTLEEEVWVVGRLRWWAVLVASLSHDIRGGSVGSGMVQIMDCNSFIFVPSTLGEEMWVVGRFRWWTVIVSSVSP